MFLTDSFQKNDRESCRTLWLAYEQGKSRSDSQEAIFDSIWTELFSQNTAFGGLCLRTRTDQKPIGFAFFVQHFCTKSLRPEGYLIDLFVLESFRGQGGGKCLLDSVLQHGRYKEWERISWITRPDNHPAQALYDRYASGDSWIRYKVSTRK